MTPSEIFDQLRAAFGEAVGPLADGEVDGYRVLSPFAWVEPSRIRDVCLHLRDRLGFDSLACLSGVDTLGLKKDAPAEIWVVYHLASVQTGDKFALKVRLDRADPRVPSIHDIWRVAHWHEREAYDMFGIIFEGHPNLKRILCCDDWIGWPLRKDYVFPRWYHEIPHERRPSATWEGEPLFPSKEYHGEKPAGGGA